MINKIIGLTFLLVLLFFFVITYTPVPSPLKYVILWFCAIAIFIWAKKRIDKNGLERCLFYMVSLLVIFSYWQWRLTETIYFLSFPDFIAAIILLLAEIYSLIMLLSSMFVCINPISGDKYTNLQNKSPELPTIDVFIPTYNEPLEIIKPTILGALNIIYPKNKIKVYVLDDGATEEKRNSKDIKEKNNAIKRYQELKNFCQRVGANYLTRKNNKNAKAGNLNEAFKKTSGDLIAVFDCDHVPTKDFLFYTLPYHLKNPNLFVVQTPHFFINPDPIEKNLRTFYAAPSENEMFYRKIQPGLNFWNSSFFCGSAALLRRRALQKIGGFLGKSITEDAETSLNLHAKGFDSAYVDRPLICGLTPETFTSYIRQRIRWAQGMTQIFLLDNPLFKKGLKWYQKICYNNCIFFWFFGFARLTFLLAPLFFIFFNLHIYNASITQIIGITLPYIITIFSIDYFLFGKVRWPFFSELYETVTSIYILPAILKVFRNPKKPKFVVTPKKENLYKDSLSPFSKPFYILFFLLILGMIYGIWRFKHETIYQDTLLVTLSWNFFNSIIIFWILGALYERKQLRRFHRAKAWGQIKIVKEGQEISAQLKDLSLSGIGFYIKEGFQHLLKKGEEIFITAKDKFNKEYKFKVKVQRINKEENKYLVGGEFTIMSDFELKDLVEFIYGDSERWQKFLGEKEKPIGFLEALTFLTKFASIWSIKGIIEFFKSIFKKPKIYQKKLSLTIICWLILNIFLFTSITHASIDNQKTEIKNIKVIFVPLKKVVPYPIKLSTIEDSISFYLPVKIPSHKIKEIIIHIDYSHSNQIIDKMSQINIEIDEKKVCQWQLNSKMPGGKFACDLKKIPKEKIYSKITIKSNMHYNPECEIPDVDFLWLQIDTNKSYIEYHLTENDNFLISDLIEILQPYNIIEPKINLIIQKEQETIANLIAGKIAKEREYRKSQIEISDEIKFNYLNFLVGNKEFINEKTKINLPLKQNTIQTFKKDGTYYITFTGENSEEIKKLSLAFTRLSIPYPEGNLWEPFFFKKENFQRKLLRPKTEKSFKELNYPDFTFTGLISKKQNLYFKIPPEQYLSENKYAILSLNLSYSSGLRPDSTLHILLNKKLISTIPIDDPKGKIYKNYKIYIPLSYFKSGSNILSFITFLKPIKANKCSPLIPESFRVDIFNSSYIKIPESGFWHILPDLESFWDTGFPYTFFLEKGISVAFILPDQEFLNDALNLIYHLTQQIDDIPVFKFYRKFEDLEKNKINHFIYLGPSEYIPETIKKKIIFYQDLGYYKTKNKIIITQQYISENPFREGIFIITEKTRTMAKIIKLAQKKKIKNDISIIDTNNNTVFNLKTNNQYEIGQRPFETKFHKKLFLHKKVYFVLIIAGIIVGALLIWFIIKRRKKEV